MNLIPGQGYKIPHASRPKNQNMVDSNSIKTLKTVQVQKKKKKKILKKEYRVGILPTKRKN